MRTKICFKCEVEQPIVNFYRHPEMGDGHLGKCKSCTRYDVRKNYADRIEQYREYDRRRYLTGHKPPPRTGIKKASGTLMHAAVASGKLTKLACEVCGNPKSEGHHADYEKPLDVIWLCRKHHKDAHRMNTDVPLSSTGT